MSRPSGVCEGQPCYTDQDREDIDAEITLKAAEVAVDSAQLTLSTAELAQLQAEKSTAESNQCAC